ncbi:MAG: TldD/PmbA family protein [Candidatus Hodarchaeales archaeon]|jgi:TldD protein
MVSDSKDATELVIERARSKGVSYAEARFVERSYNQFILKNGNPEIGAFSRSSGIGLRVLVDGSLGFASVNDLSKESIDNAVSEAVKIAGSCRRLRKKPIEFCVGQVNEHSYEVKAKYNPKDTHPEDKVKKIDEIDATLAKYSLPFRIVVLSDSIEKKYFINTDGCRIESFIPRVELYGFVVAVDKTTGNTEQAYFQRGASGGYEWLDKWNINELLGKEAETLVKIAACQEKSPTGTIDFVVGSKLGGIIAHENSGHPSEGDRILGREAAQAGESYLSASMLGNKIGNEALSIIDDPTIEGSLGYYLYDDEGVKARPRYLIKNGILNELLLDRESAFTLGTESTAAARASNFNREPIPRMSGTYIAPGDYEFDELFEDIKLGVYIVNFNEWNIDDRRYQSKYVGMECYLIKNGELTNQMIKRPILETTTPDLFQAIDGSTKELVFDAASCGKGDPRQVIPVWNGATKGTRIRNIRI